MFGLVVIEGMTPSGHLFNTMSLGEGAAVVGEGALVGLGGGGLLEYQNQRLAQTISMASCLISNPGTLQIRIQFIRQRNNPTLEQTNKHQNQGYSIKKNNRQLWQSI